MKTTVKKTMVYLGLATLVSVNAAAQSNLLAFNSEKKRMKIENSLASLTREMEKTVRYEAPKMESEPASTAEAPLVVLDDAQQLRSWLKENLEKEATHCENEAYGTATVSFIIDKNGRIKEFKTNKSNYEFEKLLTKVMKKAPAIKPLSMNGYNAKQVISLPVTYRIDVL